MHAYLQFFGVRKRARVRLIAAVSAAYPDMGITETPGCDIAPGGIRSAICRLANLPEGYVPFMAPDGTLRDSGDLPEELRATRASLLVTDLFRKLTSAVDLTEVHHLKVLDERNPEDAVSVSYGPAVKQAIASAAA